MWPLRDGQHRDLEPDLVGRRVVERQVAQPGVLGRADAVLDAGVAAVAQFEVGELAVGPPWAVLVRNPVTRCPSASVNRSCAPGCGRSLRRISRVPAGQADRSTSPVASATQAPVAGFDLPPVEARGCQACRPGQVLGRIAGGRRSRSG